MILQIEAPINVDFNEGIRKVGLGIDFSPFWQKTTNSTKERWTM